MTIIGRLTRAGRRIVDLALIALIAGVMLAVLLAKGAPAAGRQSIVIGGSSMEPAIGIGSAVLIEPVEPAELAVGDVVSMQIGPERTIYTHRVVAVVDRSDGRWLRTQGDANARADPSLVPAAAVLGRVAVVVPLFGYVIALLSLPVGGIFVLGLGATLLAVAWLLESLEPHGVDGAAAGRSRGRRGAAAGTASGAVRGVRGEPIAVRAPKTLG